MATGTVRPSSRKRREVKVDPELHRQLRIEAAKLDVPVTYLASRLIEYGLEVFRQRGLPTLEGGRHE